MKRQRQVQTFRDRGATAVLVCFLLVGLCGFAALSVDISVGRVEQRKIIAATDAAALAGSLSLHDNPGSASKARNEALDIGAANGVEQDQSTALAVEIGHWDGEHRAFQPETAPYDAVNVVTSRVVPTLFARVLGVQSMQPTAHSLAIVAGADHVTCLVPFGITKEAIEGKAFGDTLYIGVNSPGNWGKLDVGGNMSSRNAFVNGFVNGVCDTQVSINDIINGTTDLDEQDHVSPGTGFAGVKEGFRQRIQIDPKVVMAVVDRFPNGNSQPVRIVGFVVVRLIEDHNNGHKDRNCGQTNNNSGHNWNGDIQFLDEFTGFGGSGAPPEAPFASSRVLVNL